MSVANGEPSSGQPPDGSPGSTPTKHSTACSDEGGATATVLPGVSKPTEKPVVTAGRYVPSGNVILPEERPHIATGHDGKHFHSHSSGGTATEQPSAPSTVPIDAHSPIDLHAPPLQQGDDWKTGKAGIAVVAVSAGDPDSEDYIDGCIAGNKMVECLGTELGYHTIHEKNMTSVELDKLLYQIEQRTLPASYRRAIFYFFGHGNATSLKMADGQFVERRYIVDKFQKICPTGSGVTKTIILESCRVEKAVTCKAIPETTMTYASLSVCDCSKPGGHYTVSKDTIVIEATDRGNKAYYHDGCGLFTHHFTALAPILNVSLDVLLVKVRTAVVAETAPDKADKEQFLEYENMLMSSIHLLAESQGTARVTATDVSTTPSVLGITIDWRFDL